MYDSFFLNVRKYLCNVKIHSELVIQLCFLCQNSNALRSLVSFILLLLYLISTIIHPVYIFKVNILNVHVKLLFKCTFKVNYLSVHLKVII